MESVGRLALLASAVAGRSLQVEAAEPGAPAWTDGATVFVAPDSPSALVAVTAQAALLGAGSLDSEVLRVLRRRPNLVSRYLAVEAQRALLAHEQLLPVVVRSLLDLDLATRSSSPAHSFELALAGVAPEAAPAAFGTIRPGQVQVGDRADDADPVVRQYVPRRGAWSELEALEDEDAAGPVADLSSPVGGSGALGRLLARLFGQARASGSGPAGADAPTRWSGRGRPTGSVLSVSSARQLSLQDVPLGDVGGRRYPEWDGRQRRYKPDWCTVVERAPSDAELQPCDVPRSQSLRRPLGRLGMEFERRHRQLDGDALDVDAVVEAWAELAAGAPAHEALYIDSVRRRRDLSVLVLLDVSGSAGEPGSLGRSVHEHQRDVAGALVAALDGLGDRVALYGFRSQGRGAVSVIPVKRFGDRLDELVFERLGGMAPGAYTRLGAAIRHGAWLLDDQAGTARRLLVVVSDGFAYDHGYERAYGEADARMALAEVRRGGIGCLCLSVGTRTDPAALQRVFGTAAHAAVPGLAQLPWIVGPLFRSALGAAEVQRRAHIKRTRAGERLVVERRTA
jgi:hypothetical protein